MTSLRIVLAHHHLRRGGVTRVIRNTLDALKDNDIRLCVLSGEMPVDDWPVPVALAESMAYAGDEAPDWRDVLREMRDATSQTLGGAPDVWHIHNHALGKNPAFTRAVRQLADDGERLLLQIHDFAEDGRPTNYRRLMNDFGAGESEEYGRIAYPLAPHVIYALLNPRDDLFIARAGADESNRVLLPNAVKLDEPKKRPKARRGFYLYPTRAIRRKNIGEFLLWAALDEQDGQYAVTLAPENPLEQPLYRRWTTLAEELKLPVEFEAGLKTNLPFSEFLATAEAICTTSVQEGFGMTFLEPWLAERPLAGRDLPEITGQFGSFDVDLSGLYQQLLVPLNWIDVEAFRRKLAEAYERFAQAYQRAVNEEQIQRALDAARNGDCIDFARLDLDSQEQVVRHVARDVVGAKRLIAPRHLYSGDEENFIQAQRNNVRKHFNRKQYGEQLMRVYRRLAGTAASDDVGALNSQALLDQFIAPERFIQMLYEA